MRLLQNRNVSWAIATLFIMIALVVHLPTPGRILLDADWALQLAGGFQLRAGDIPFRDYPSVYGPLVYMTSAVAQWLGGDRFITEVILVMAGYGVGYALLYRMSVQITGNVLLGLLILLLGLVLIPRMYKYYIVLWPVTSLYACWRIIANSSRTTVLFLALITAISGLFRADFGVYSAIVGIMTVVHLHWGNWDQMRRKLGLLMGGTLAFALPILIWLWVQGSLWIYLYDSSIRTLSFTDGLALPLPEFRTNVLFSPTNGFLVSFWLALTIPLGVFLASFSSQPTSTEKITWRVTALWAQLLQFQGYHRSGFSHFEQGFTLTLIALAILIMFAFENTRRIVWWRGLLLAVLASYYALLLATGISHNAGNRFTEKLQGFEWAQYNLLLLPVDDMNVILGLTTTNPVHQAGSLIVECTSPQQKIATGPNLINFYYTTQRHFVGRMWIAYPYMLTPEDEQATLEAYRDEGPPAVFVYQSGFQYDNRPERNPFTYLPTLYAYFQEKYVVVTKFGSIHIAVPREGAVTHPCNTQQRNAPEPVG